MAPVDQPASCRSWEAAAAAVLRRAGRLTGTDPDQLVHAELAGSTVEGIVIPPLGTAASIADLPDRGAPGTAPFTRGRHRVAPDFGWDIRAALIDPDPAVASASALTDLENGVTSLWCTVGGRGTQPDDLATALAGVQLDLAPVVLRAAGDVGDLDAAHALARVLSGVPPAPGSSLGADPIGRALRENTPPPDDLGTAVRRLLDVAGGLAVDAFVVDGTTAHLAGAGDAGEVGYSLAVAVAYLREAERAGCDLDDLLRGLEFRYTASADQFLTIAKFRAARSLWSRVCEIVGAASDVGGQRQHAVTAPAMMTRVDPWNNLLRTTIAALAAGVAGADAVTVLPFDSPLGIPDALGRRTARNISALLIAESQVAAVADPAGGSYAVELLTERVAEAAWAEFQRIEADGGICAALRDGSFRSRVALVAAERTRRIDHRLAPVTGVTEFPDPAEITPTRRPWPTDEPDPGWARDFHAMRVDPAPVPVFVATLGSVAEHAARAGFLINALTAGGVRSVTSGPTSTVEEVVAAYRAAVADGPLPVVGVAGSDKICAGIGLDVIAALRDAGAHWVVLAGPAAGLPVDDSLAARGDARAFLLRTRDHLRLAGVTP